MASLSLIPSLILAISSALVLIITPTFSLTCTSQKFSNSKTFTNCTDLPLLNSYLHFTYNSSNSSLSIAFVAPPLKPDGWVSWAINPTSTGMAGAQALVASKSNGSVTAKTYNISSFSSVVESKLSFDVWDLSAESEGDNVVIFASVKVAEKAERVNQVWQVGPMVDGQLRRHEMGDANKNSFGVLELVASTQGGGSGSSPPPPPAPAPAPEKDGAPALAKGNAGICIGLLVLLGCFIGF